MKNHRPESLQHLVVNPHDGRKFSVASSEEPLVIYKLLVHSYPLDRLPQWGSAKLWAMANAEAMRRSAENAMKTTPHGHPERKRILEEVAKHQNTFFMHEKTVLAALKTESPLTAKEMRDERALAAMEGGAIGEKMRNLANAGKDDG